MSAFLRRLLWSSSWATGGSGLVYAWMKYLMHGPDDWSVVNHPLQPWMLKVHIVAAPVLVFALGAVVGGHAWRFLSAGSRRGRGTGIVVLALTASMVLSGSLIQTMTEAAWLAAVAWIHGVAGAMYLGTMVVHRRVTRRRRRAETPTNGTCPAARPPLLVR